MHLKRELLITLLTSLFMLQQHTTSAYFNLTKETTHTVEITLGSWTWGEGTLIDYSPIGTVVIEDWVADNHMETLDEGDYFIFDNQLFIVTNPSGYNYVWHGLPDEGAGGWAFINLSLEWAGEHQRYRTGAIVRIGDRFFQAMHQGNMNNPITNHGSSGSGKPWREVEPMEDFMFPFIADTTLRNYSAPYSQFVVQKDYT